MNTSQPGVTRDPQPDDYGRSLDPAVLHRIEQALARVGDFGEVRLIVVRGQLKFIETLQSENMGDLARRMNPGMGT